MMLVSCCWTDAAHGHIERARNRGRGQRQNIDFGTQRFELLFLRHPEAVLLIDDQQAHLGQLNAFGKQLVGADDDIRLAALNAL